MRVLILTASAGDGHIAAARALEAALLARGTQPEVLDVLDAAPRAFRLWFQGGYETLVRKMPRLWGYLYRGADKPGLFYGVQTALDVLCLEGLRRQIGANPPEWVLCTHSVAQPMLERLRRSCGSHAPRVGVAVTDVYPHIMWLRGNPELLFVHSSDTESRIARRRPDLADRVRVTGIPVHPWFAEKKDADVLRRELGWSADEIVLLIVSGGIGAGPLLEVVRALTEDLHLGSGARVRLVVVCGRHRRNYAECARYASSTGLASSALSVQGYVPHERFRAMLRAADLLIGKPGGLTSSEALACGLPMVIFRPLLIPGQEDANAEYLIRHGAALEARDLAELTRQVGVLLGDAARLLSMREAASGLGRPDAALVIIDTLLRGNVS